MTTITEDYVSFEVAKLLKEKGFDERSYGAYNLQGEFQEGYGEWNKTATYYAAPTLQMAMKWLREVYGLNIEVCRTINEYNGYEGIITLVTDNNNIKIINVIPTCKYPTYEQAAETAIKFCLENYMKGEQVMTQEEIKDKMQEGFAKIQPKVAEMTNIIMDAYQEGFNTCFELLTGQKFK